MEELPGTIVTGMPSDSIVLSILLNNGTDGRILACGLSPCTVSLCAYKFQTAVTPNQA